MSKRAAAVREIFKGLARANKTFTIELGPLRATGAPAVLAGVCGVVLASGVVALLARTADRLPETLREVNVLARTVRGERAGLNP